MNITELIKLLLYGSLIFNYVTAIYPHKEKIFDKLKISNEQINRPQTIRTKRSEITETTKEVIIKAAVGNFRLPDFIIPKQYSIKLALDIENDIFYGECDISIMILKTAQNITLHSVNLEVTQIMLTEINAKHEIMYKTCNISYIHELQIIVLDFLHDLRPNNYTLSIMYKSYITNDVGGFVKIPYINGTGEIKWLITTSNSVTGMRHLFPCWDEPGLKANFTIAIRHPEHYNVFSNTPSFYISSTSEQTMTRFATTPEIPTYHIAILLFDKNDYIHISPIQNLKLWRREWIDMQWDEIFRLIEVVTSTVEYMWQLPKGYLLRNHYAIAGLREDGVDKLQFILYREEDIIYNKEIDPIARKIELSRIIGRKVVGQLFGTAVSSSWWSYMWLNEGIARLFGVYTINKIMPDIRMLDLFVVQTQQESLRLDDSQIMKPLDLEVNSISEINSLFSFTYYIKAPFILRMLHYTVGDEIFQKGINAYLRRQTGSLDDFWTAMQSVYDSQTTRLKINVKNLMNPWIQEKQYPILNVTETFDTKWAKIILETASKKWKVPLTNQVYMNLKRILPKFCLARKQRHFLVKCNNSEYNRFIIINQQQIGYYRVFYNTESWLRIVRYLNSENYTNIHVLTRAQIIDDTFHLTISGELHSSAFWEVMTWYPMFKAIEHMSYILPFDNVDNIHFKMRLQKLLGTLLQKIGYEEKDNDNNLVKCLRQEAVRWACILGDRECKKVAEFQLQLHLLNPIKNKLLPWWKEWTFCNGLSVSSISLDKLFKDLDEILIIKDPEVFKILACYNDISSLVSLLYKLKTLKNYYVSTYTEDNARTITIIKNYIYLFYYVIQKHGNDNLFNYILLNNLEELKPKEISTTAALINIINYTYSNKALCQIQKWIHENLTNSLLQNTEHKIHMRLKKHYVGTIDSVCETSRFIL
ncbi:hypothetical protein P5V15_010024 [Pogonomyrmex californicus]